MKKLAEDRKRQKNEDHLARQKVKEQIARDREEREEHSKSSVPTLPQQPTLPQSAKKDYTTSRLQVLICCHP